MADPFDIANLWWLRPRNPQGSSSLPAFALGAKMQQDRIQNDIDTKRMLLDQQYRMENLRAQDRWTDARIQNYESLAQQRRDEESDMEALTRIMGPLSEGRAFEAPQFKTERGARAFAQINNSFSLQRSRARLTSEALKQQKEYDDKLLAIKDRAPDLFAAINDELKTTGHYTDAMIRSIKEAYDREVAPFQVAPPEGMVPQTLMRKLPGGEHVTFTRKIPTRTEQLPPNKMALANQYVDREAKKLQALGRPVNYDELIRKGKEYADKLQADEEGTPEPIAPPIPPASGKRVKVIDKNGRAFTLPESQVDWATNYGGFKLNQ